MLFEKDASGFTRKAYTRALGFPGGIGGLISLKRFEQEDEEGIEEKTSYYHYDALGSVRGLSNEQGKLSVELDYDAFGNETKHKGSVKKNTYRFSSKEFEDHAGLYFFGARYYDPEIGRWLTPDPLGFIDGPNRYTYVANNPLNFIDLYGLRKYIIVSASVGGGIIYTYGKSEFLLIDPGTRIVTRFESSGHGIGINVGIPVSANFEIGEINLNNPNELEGSGVDVTVYAAAKLGISFSAFGTSFFGSGAASLSGGGAVGAGAGISGIITNSRIVGVYDFTQLAPDIQEAVNKAFSKERIR